MSQTGHRDLEDGIYPVVRGHPDAPGFAPNQKSQPLQGESSFGDSSGLLFSLYSKIAAEEDSKMTERWQKDADGILIFTGLFSAAVAALLALSVQDLRPNSQDTSAFYLEIISQLLANPNVQGTSTPFAVAKPPPFSPPRYAVWVNSLWLLSLVISLTCALLATLLHQWARRYVRFTQPPRCAPEKRARMRAFFSDGVDKMHLPWAVEALPTLLHLSLFLFFAGLVIFLFNINHDVFSSVIWWIGIFTMAYAWITLMPILRHDSPYYAPLSSTAFLLYASIQHALFKVLALVTWSYGTTYQTWERFRDSRDVYRGWIVGGIEKAAEETFSEQSSEIDLCILDSTISALGGDDTLEKFFEAIPGFINSKLVEELEREFPFSLHKKLWGALNGFQNRTLSSNSVIESVKTRRLIICMNTMNAIPGPFIDSEFLRDILEKCLGQVAPSIETACTLARWYFNSDQRIAQYARHRVAGILGSVRERDDRWTALAKDHLHFPESVLQEYIAHGDSVSLAWRIRSFRFLMP